MEHYDVREHGAVGDGETLDTDAIGEAVEASHRAGGGVVRLAGGVYRSGSIRLRDGVSLQIAADATLRAVSPDAGEYDDPVENPYDDYQDFGHSHWRNSLLWAERSADVAVVGAGSIDGSGLTASNDVPEGGADTALAFRECCGVTVRGVTMHDCGHFAVLATGCDDVRIRNVDIDTGRDGVNLVACRHSEVLDSTIRGHDDAVAFKSDYSLGYERESRDLRVDNCVLASNCNAIQFGSETVGDIRNVRVRDVEVEEAGKAAIGVTTNDGGIVEDVSIADVQIRKSAVPIFFQVIDRGSAPGDRPVGRLRDITVENVDASECRGEQWDGVFTSSITGHPERPITDVTLRNVSLEYPGGSDAGDGTRRPPVDPDGYQPRKLGTRPAAGLYCQHVRDLTLADVEFAFESADGRPTLVVDDADGVDVDRFDADREGAVDDVRIRSATAFEFDA